MYAIDEGEVPMVNVEDYISPGESEDDNLDDRALKRKFFDTQFILLLSTELLMTSSSGIHIQGLKIVESS